MEMFKEISQITQRFVCRQKWTLMLCLLFALIIVPTVTHFLKWPSPGDTDMDNVPQELYEDVFRRWYNLTDGEKHWYNLKNDIKWDDVDLLREVKRNWIIQEYDAAKPYSLNDPYLNDTSMGQAQMIREIFQEKKGGFFVECGAYDGETRSNTLNLERFYNWTGLLIEADPINFTKMLIKNRKAWLTPSCLSIEPRPMVANFLMAKNIGRLHDPEHSEEGIENTADVAHTGTHVKVQCFPLATYAAALDVTTIDYFSLDIEGNEMEVLETIPFDRLDIKTLSVEYVHGKKDRDYMINFMKKRGYHVYNFVERDDNLANDVIFVKNTLPNSPLHEL
ncbi:uncharacterized protein LOC107273247 [Cephus cinctus]|uniref:Uncharacterized protein LOC107273247 n=1 Tax=Cephus cinctus TaxID=211228 RepID=A0AAJ7CD00_CEPCN|nr:uncharacterized protein LOC107273247 [Cephus cinctus]